MTALSPKWEHSFHIDSPDNMEQLGAALAAVLHAGDVLVLTGPLGAGKTTLTRGLGDALGVRGPITSPTFVVARTHPALSGGTALIHVDAYRLADARELEDLDIDFEGAIVVVEWGAGLVDQLVDSWLELVIERPANSSEDIAGEQVVDDADSDVAEPRALTLRGFGPRWSEAPILKGVL